MICSVEFNFGRLLSKNGHNCQLSVLQLIKTISISNFRAITKGEISNLSKVNVLIGKNNSGKSTVLDFLCFFRASLNPMNDFGEWTLKALLNRRVNRNYPSALEFFHNYSPENQINLGLVFEKGQPIDFVASYSSGRISYSWLNPSYKPGGYVLESPGMKSTHEDIKSIARFDWELTMLGMQVLSCRRMLLGGKIQLFQYLTLSNI